MRNPSRPLCLLLALLLVGLTSESLSGQMMGATDGGHGWLILPRGEHFEVYQHAPGDGWRAWRRSDGLLYSLPERAACFAAEAGRSELTIVFAPSAQPGQRDVRRKEAVLHELSKRWTWQPANRLRVLPSLPGDSQLRGLVADAEGVIHVLLQGQSLSVARPTPRREADEETGRTDPADSPPGAAADSADGETEQREIDPGLRLVGPATRLLRLDDGGWTERALPDAVEARDQAAWRLLRTPTGVALLARRAGEAEATLFETTEDEAWQEMTLPLPLDEIAVAGWSDGGLVLGRRIVEPSIRPDRAPTLILELIRGGQALLIRQVKEVEEQALVCFAAPDVLIVSDSGELQPRIRVVELATGRLREDGPFGEPPVLTQRSLQPLLVVFALLVAAVSMVVFKPEPGAVPVLLGSETEPGDIAGRFLAFLVDLLPTVIVVGLVTGSSLTDSLDAVRSVVLFQATAETLPLALAIMILTLLHQGVCEWLTGRSLGKLVAGLVVLDALDGKLSFRQVVVRNAMKFVLLLFPILLLLAIGSPWRQHLGDMAGRTVVAGRRPVEEADG